MKSVFFTIVFFMSACLSVNAQSGTIVTGYLLTNDTKQPIAFASIRVLSENNNLVHGGISEEDGFFSIQGLKEATYTIRVSSLGYKDYETQVLIGALNKNYNLGKLYLVPSTTKLQSIEVTVDKSEVNKTLDKKSYNMNNQIAQSGGSVMDAMKAMPSISFSQEGKVLLRGSDKVLVLIDGKQSSLTGFGNQKGLDNLPASNIERIEIMNNPSAKYDAAGMAGIVNIIYKKEQQKGIHGSVGFAYGLGALSKRKEDLPTDLGSFSPTPKYIPSLSINYKEEKVSAFLQSEVLFQERLPNNEFTTRYYTDGSTIASQVPENRKQTHYIVKGGINYQLTEKDELSLSGIYDWESHVDSSQVPYIDLLTNRRNRYINWNEEEITGYLNTVLAYTHQYKEAGHKLSARLLYSKGWEDETYYINDSSSVRSNGRDVTSVLGTEHTTSLQVDYTKPLRWGRVETGAKLQIRSLPVTYEQERGSNSILYEGLGNWSKWGESIYAAYGNWVHEQDRYAVEAGLRAEYTHVFYKMDANNTYYEENDRYDYFRLFPNVRLSYKLNAKNRFSVFYNQRIDRPGEPELRMYAKSDDHELVKVGNPYLRPQYTQSAEVAYKTKWNKGSLFVSAYYRWITDPYKRVYTEDATNTDFDVILKSYANTGAAEHNGLELVASQKVGTVWKVSGNLNLYQIKIQNHVGTLLFPNEHTFTIDATTDTTLDAKIINTFSLPNTWQLQLTALYFAPKDIAQGRQLERSSVDIGVKKKLFKGKGEATLAFTDIFNNYGIVQEVYGDGFTALYQNFYETQILRLGFKYKF